MTAEIIRLRRAVSDSQWAEAWAGLLAMMEANGRSKVEIGIEDVRRIARDVAHRGRSC